MKLRAHLFNLLIAVTFWREDRNSNNKLIQIEARNWMVQVAGWLFWFIWSIAVYELIDEFWLKTFNPISEIKFKTTANWFKLNQQPKPAIHSRLINQQQAIKQTEWIELNVFNSNSIQWLLGWLIREWLIRATSLRFISIQCGKIQFINQFSEISVWNWIGLMNECRMDWFCVIAAWLIHLIYGLDWIAWFN